MTLTADFKSRSALFICEGSSDLPLATLVGALFLDRGVVLRVTAPDFSLLSGSIGQETARKVRAGLDLFEAVPDVLLVHRDADSAGVSARRSEVVQAGRSADLDCPLVPIIPVFTTEAWLLLDAEAIRMVAGNPRGRGPLELPRPRDVEQVADPKRVLGQCLLNAAEVTGRRRDKVAKRFTSHRRQLLERLDRAGPVNELASFRALVADVDVAVDQMSGGADRAPSGAS